MGFSQPNMTTGSNMGSDNSSNVTGHVGSAGAGAGVVGGRIKAMVMSRPFGYGCAMLSSVLTGVGYLASRSTKTVSLAILSPPPQAHMPSLTTPSKHSTIIAIHFYRTSSRV
jgi:hypothetical protein